MHKTDRLLRAALSGLMAVGLGAVSAQGSADSDNREQCAGVIKSGQNDCATSKNACHGHVMVDSDPEAWIYLPTGTCERIVGARVVQVVDPTPKTSSVTR